jgi:hypothetical protein
MSEPALDRSEVEQLLPWHAARTLSRREAVEIDAALARDPELMRRYMLAGEELAATVELNELLGEPSPRAMRRLFAVIDAQSRHGRLDVVERLRLLLGSLTARQIAFSTCMAALLVLTVGLVGGVVIGERQNRIAQTAGTDSAGIAGYAIVRFAQEARIESISALLAANRATIVDGPGADGVYRVRIAALPKPATVYRGIENGSWSEQQRDRAVANLREAAGVVQFAAAQP